MDISDLWLMIFYGMSLAVTCLFGAFTLFAVHNREIFGTVICLICFLAVGIVAVDLTLTGLGMNTKNGADA